MGSIAAVSMSLQQSSKCRSGDFVAVYYQLHHGVSAFRIESDHLVIHFLSYCIDEVVVIFYGTPPKAKDLLLCETDTVEYF